MKIIIEDLPDDGEEELILRCHKVDGVLLELISSVKNREQDILGYEGESIYRLTATEVYYFEAVDNRVFIYCQDKVFVSKQRLYELEKIHGGGDFLRISKSVILNLRKISSLSPAFSGRFEAVLQNGEKIIISRQYVPDLKKKLKI